MEVCYEKTKKTKERTGNALKRSPGAGLMPGVGIQKVAAETTSDDSSITLTALYTNGAGTIRYLLDGTTANQWSSSFTDPAYVVFKLSEPVCVNGYSMHWMLCSRFERTVERGKIEMQGRELLSKMFRTYFILVTLNDLVMFVTGSIIKQDAVMGYQMFLYPLLYALDFWWK